MTAAGDAQGARGRATDRRTRGALLAVLVVSTALKLALLTPASATSPIGDARDYVATAGALHAFGSYVGSRAPGYPATLYAAIWISALGGEGGADRQAQQARERAVARAIGVLFSGVTVWLVYLLGCELFDRRAGLAAAVLFAFYPDFVGFSHLLWAESQFLMLNAAWALSLLRGTRRGSRGWLFAAGVGLGLAALTRQVALPILPLALLWIVLARPGGWAENARLAAPVALAAVLVIAPWTARNVAAHGSLVLIEPKVGVNLLWGASGRMLPEVERAGIDAFTPPAERDRLARERAIEIVRDDPAGYLERAITENLTGLWGPGSTVLDHLRSGEPRSGDRRSREGSWGYPPIPAWLGRTLIVLFVASYVGVMALSALGAGLAPRWRDTALFVAIGIQTSVLHMFLFGAHRHRLFLVAFALPYAGYAISRRWSEIAALATPRRGAVAAALLLTWAALALGATDRPVTRPWREFAASPGDAVTVGPDVAVASP